MPGTAEGNRGQDPHAHRGYAPASSDGWPHRRGDRGACRMAMPTASDDLHRAPAAASWNRRTTPTGRHRIRRAPTTQAVLDVPPTSSGRSSCTRTRLDTRAHDVVHDKDHVIVRLRRSRAAPARECSPRREPARQLSTPFSGMTPGQPTPPRLSLRGSLGQYASLRSWASEQALSVIGTEVESGAETCLHVSRRHYAGQLVGCAPPTSWPA